MCAPRDDVKAQHVRRSAAAAATAWAVGFALLHAAWAAGSRLLLSDTGAADDAFGRPWFVAYNAAVVVGSLVAAGAVFTSVRSRRPGRRRVARWLVWASAGMLTVRGGIGAVQLMLTIVTGRSGQPVAAWSIDLLMLVGGVLFAAAAAVHSAS